MPGIVGLITNLPRSQAESQLLKMTESLRHESFYVTGTLMDEDLGIYVGWVTRKNSFSDGMPLTTEKGDISLVFSGEDFPEPGTKQRLKGRGHNFEVAGPAYLVHLYEDDVQENSTTFPGVLNGRFHGLLIDRNQGTAKLFNARYGIDR